MDEGNSAPNSDVPLSITSIDFKTRLQRYAFIPSAPSPTDNDAQPDAVKTLPLRHHHTMPSPRKRTPKMAVKVPATPPSRKRKTSAFGSTSPASAKRRSTTKERSRNDPYNPPNLLVDSLRPGLILVFVGLNPGLNTAATGHAYAHSSNLFWKLLHWSGITPIQHPPSDTRRLMDLYSIGNTNLCARPTRSGDGLSTEEQDEGGAIIEKKMREFKPEAVCIVGKTIWTTIWKSKKGTKPNKDEFKWGWQDEEMWLGREVGEDGEVIWEGARTFVTTSTSGLAASLKPAEKLEIWRPLGEWVAGRRVVDDVPKAEESDFKQE